MKFIDIFKFEIKRISGIQWIIFVFINVLILSIDVYAYN